MRGARAARGNRYRGRLRSAMLATIDFITRDDAGKPVRHYTLIAVLCEWRAGDGETLGQVLPRWAGLRLAEAEKLDTFPDTLPAIGWRSIFVSSDASPKTLSPPPTF